MSEDDKKPIQTQVPFKKKRSFKGTAAIRVKIIQDDIFRLEERSDREYAELFKISKRQASRYKKLALDKLAAANNTHKNQRRNKAIYRLEKLASKFMKDGKDKLLLETIQELNKLQSLYAEDVQVAQVESTSLFEIVEKLEDQPKVESDEEV